MVEARSVNNVKNTQTGTGTRVKTRGRTQDGNWDGSGDGNESSSTIAEMGMGTRMGSGRAEERRRSARNRTRLVEAMWGTGETWVERGKNVEKKGLVQ